MLGARETTRWMDCGTRIERPISSVISRVEESEATCAGVAAVAGATACDCVCAWFGEPAETRVAVTAIRQAALRIVAMAEKTCCTDPLLRQRDAFSGVNANKKAPCE